MVTVCPAIATPAGDVAVTVIGAREPGGVALVGVPASAGVVLDTVMVLVPAA